jgi:sugar-specific transcriptional regulator TrmB
MNATELDRLMRLGLTQYEARAYVALIRRDGSTPAEIATLAGVPRPRIYDVLHSLVAKGLATDRPGRVAKYVPTPPAEAMARLVEAHRQRLNLVEADAEALAVELGPAFLEGRAHDGPLEFIEVIRDPETLGKRFNELQRQTAREMLTFSKSPYAVRLDRNTTGMDLARQHMLRTVYELSALGEPVQREGVRRFIEAGEQVRFVTELPMKLGIIDERTVMFTMPDPVAGHDLLTTVVIDHPTLARVLKMAFETVWRNGMTVEEAYDRLGIASRDV